MKIIQKDVKKGIIKVIPQHQDDLWLLSQVILAGAFASAKTTRKVKISETKVEKKTYYLKLKVEKAVYEHDVLRISGSVESENDDIPKGSAHSFSIEPNNDIKIEQEWFSYMIDKIEDATKEKAKVLLVVLDRENVYFAQMTHQGYKILSSFEGDVEKKDNDITGNGNFYSDVTKKLKDYDGRFGVDSIVVASPAFFKEDFMKQLNDDNLKKKIILATCSSVSENAFTELMKRDEVKGALKQERIREELAIVDELLTEVSKEGKCTYGFEHVKAATEAGAVDKFIITTNIIEDYREKEKFAELENLMKLVEQINGKVVIVTSSNDAGKKLDGIAGIAALLRYKI